MGGRVRCRNNIPKDYFYGFGKSDRYSACALVKCSMGEHVDVECEQWVWRSGLSRLSMQSVAMCAIIWYGIAACNGGDYDQFQYWNTSRYPILCGHGIHLYKSRIEPEQHRDLCPSEHAIFHNDHSDCDTDRAGITDDWGALDCAGVPD